MPRLVDHADRRAELAQALWRVVVRQGVHAVSVRSVATEAGTSPSALRHYFRSQDDLLVFALDAVIDRVSARIAPHVPDLRGREGARLVLDQMLPLDEERRAETAVYLAFIGRTPGSPALQAVRDEADAKSLGAVRFAVQLLADSGAVAAGRDLDQESQRLYALVDGLAMHGSLMSHRPAAEELVRLLDLHLADLKLRHVAANSSPAGELNELQP